MRNDIIRYWTVAFFIVAQPIAAVRAETLPELDALAEVAVDEEKGIIFAREQAERGELLDAIATLERVLALHPKSDTARLHHAMYLCMIDDRMGGIVELGKLKAKTYPAEFWAEAMTICSPVGEE